MRRWSVIAACILLVAGCGDDDGGDADDPADGGGRRVVEADDLVAMAVEADGTRWFVDATGDVLRDGEGGELTTEVPGADGVRLAEHAAMAVTPGGDILIVSDGGHRLHRLAPASPGEGLAVTDLSGIPDDAVLTGVAAGADGTVFVADGMTGTVYAVATSGGAEQDGTATAEAVAGTPDAGCRGRVRPPVPVGLAVTSGGDPVVADPSCDLYVPGQGPVAETPDCLDSPDAAAFPVTAAVVDDRQIVVGGRFCELVWRVPAGGGDPVEVAGDAELDGFPRAVAVDDGGVVHVLDDRGVVAVDLPG